MERETRRYCTNNYDDHSVFRGIIKESDFYGYTSMQEIADRIAQDQRFNEHCKKITLNKRMKKEKGMCHGE